MKGSKQRVSLYWIAGMAIGVMVLLAMSPIQAEANQFEGIDILEIPFGYIIIPGELSPGVIGGINNTTGEHSPDPPPPPPPKGGGVSGTDGDHSPDPPPPPPPGGGGG